MSTPTHRHRVRRGVVAVSALLFAATAGAVAPASPAAADAALAMSRCTLGQVPSHDSPHVMVRGNGGGNDPAGVDPPNILEPGDAFVIVPDMATRVNVDRLGANYGPDGNGTVAGSGWPFPGLPQFSAVLRFNNKPGGWVDAPARATAFNRCTTWDRGFPVRLLFAVNDPGPGDNGGAWKFHVLIFKASSPNTAAMDRCHRGQGADHDNPNVSVSAINGGSEPPGPNPGNILSRGQVLRIIPNYDSYAYSDGWNNWHRPYGNLVSAPPTGWPFFNLFQYSPVLRFNNNPGGWVGVPAQATAFGGCLLWTDSFPVRLAFYVNDPDTTDNWGAWTFRVMIYR